MALPKQSEVELICWSECQMPGQPFSLAGRWQD